MHVRDVDMAPDLVLKFAFPEYHPMSSVSFRKLAHQSKRVKFLVSSSFLDNMLFLLDNCAFTLLPTVSQTRIRAE
jgi:hypothetical protein